MTIPGELIITDDVPATFSSQVIEAFRGRAGDPFSLGLSGGNTARRCYESLAESAGNQIDWWKVDVYWVDECCIPHDHEDSNYRLAREALLDRVGAANATHVMRCAEGPDPYQLRLGDLGGLDLIHLGLGADGSTASLFAGSAALEADPGRLVSMSEDPSGMYPYQRMTITLGGIARSKLVVVTVEGEHKAQALASVAARDDLPASLISAAAVVWIVDDEAARLL